MADEEVYRLRQSMDQAAMIDREAVQDGRPAIEKLKLLPEVVAVLQKCVYHLNAELRLRPDSGFCGRPHLEATILEADILTQMKNWLEPIGKAMPALNIQRALLEALGKVSISHCLVAPSKLFLRLAPLARH
jgi:transcription factor SPN1